MPLDDYSGIPISFWPNLNRIHKNLKVKAVLFWLFWEGFPITMQCPLPKTISLVCCCPNHRLGAGCHLSLRHLDLSKVDMMGQLGQWTREQKLVLKCANSHYFHIGDDGYQPNPGGLYTHYKGISYYRWDEFIPDMRSWSTLAQMVTNFDVFCMRWLAFFGNGSIFWFYAMQPLKSSLHFAKWWKVPPKLRLCLAGCC